MSYSTLTDLATVLSAATDDAVTISVSSAGLTAPPLTVNRADLLKVLPAPIVTPTIPRAIPIGPAQTSAAVNLRQTPGGAFLALLLAGTSVTILDTPPVIAALAGSSYTWVSIKSGAVTGWVAEKFLSTIPVTVPIVPPVVPTAPRKKYGIQFLGSGYDADASRVIAANLGACKSVDNPGYLKLFHNAYPDRPCVYRQWAGSEDSPDNYVATNGGPKAAADKWVADHRGQLVDMPFAWHESFNEHGMSPAYCAFEMYRIRAMSALGVKACVLNIGSGQTEAAKWQTNEAKALVDTVIQYDARIGVHAYWQTLASANYGGSYFDSAGNWQGALFPSKLPDGADIPAWTGGRTARDIHTLAAQGQGAAKFLITEAGWDDLAQPGNGIYSPHTGKTRGIKSSAAAWQSLGLISGGATWQDFARQQLQWANDTLWSYPQIDGVMLFAFGNATEWTDYDLRVLF